MHKRKKHQEINHVGWLAFLLVCGLLGAVWVAKAQPQFFQPQVRLAKSSNIASVESLQLDFSQRMLPSWRDMRISVVPAQKITTRWINGNKSVLITPEDLWLPNTSYQVVLANGRSLRLAAVAGQFAFVTENYPQIKTFFPLKDERGVVVDIEDPIFAEFDKSLGDFNVKFEFSPAVQMSYELDNSMRKVRLLPQAKMLEGQVYGVNVLVKHKQEPSDKYQKIWETSFETKKALVPASLWDKDPQKRLEQAKLNTTAQITAGKYADVNLSQQIVVRFENGVALDANYISSGKPGMDTPVGTFEIHNKFPRVWSKKYALFMPYWMALVGSGEFGFHELPEWPGGIKEGANHLGRPVSHGCVRLGVGPAKALYDWAEIGMPVIIHK